MSSIDEMEAVRAKMMEVATRPRKELKHALTPERRLDLDTLGVAQNTILRELDGVCDKRERCFSLELLEKLERIDRNSLCVYCAMLVAAAGLGRRLADLAAGKR